MRHLQCTARRSKLSGADVVVVRDRGLVMAVAEETHLGAVLGSFARACVARRTRALLGRTVTCAYGNVH